MKHSLQAEQKAAHELAEIRAQMKLFPGSRLAELSGVSESVISRLQSGQRLGTSFLKVRAIQHALTELSNKGWQ